MTTTAPLQPSDPERDLVLERALPVPPAAVWRAWTEPALRMRWFAPAPWRTVDCEFDPRPGGTFRTVMQGPESDPIDRSGCVLEVVDGERLVWTTAMGPGFRPAPAGEAPFTVTAIIELAAEGAGTRYRATVRHADAAGKQAHDAMGFHEGWGKALDQLVEVARSLG